MGAEIKTKLPIVTEVTLMNIIESDRKGSDDWGKKVQRTGQQLLADNPQLVKFIDSQLAKYPEIIHDQIADVLLAVIAVLEQQASADELSNKFQLPPEENING